MTQQDKQLLLKDLCARLPYGVRYKGDGGWGINPYQHTTSLCTILTSEEPLVYLRSMSSMTEEERKELSQISEEYLDDWSTADSNLLKWNLDAKVSSMRATFYNSHHLDWNGLIEKGIALEAPNDMYKNE